MAKKDIKEINNIRELQNKMVEFCCLVEKSHIWKESGIVTQERREVEVDTLLLGNDKNNVIANKVFSCF